MVFSGNLGPKGLVQAHQLVAIRQLSEPDANIRHRTIVTESDLRKHQTMEWRERKRVTLLAIDLVVLRGNDLPLTIAFQPRICPDLALLRVWMRFVFADGVLA